MDIKDFYLNTLMTRYEYIRLRITDMPEDVINHYKLNNIVTLDKYIYCKIQKGMYSYHRPGSLPSNYSKNASKSMATNRAHPARPVKA